MRVRNFQSQLWLPQSRDNVFAFFSDAQNLDLITPPWLHFRTTTPGSCEMRLDTIIDHRLRFMEFHCTGAVRSPSGILRFDL